MPDLVAILEDNSERIAEMRACLAELLPGMEAVFFEDAQRMIAWLGEHLDEVVLISLDHDLPLRNEAGNTVDCGTGRQVADYLASTPPTCRVVIHSSNDNCASGMFFALKDGGWPVSRVYPSADQAWRREAWATHVAEVLFVFYPEVRPHCELGRLLQAELDRRHIRATVESIDPTCWANVQGHRRQCQVLTSRRKRLFTADFGERGVMLVHLSTPSFELLVEALGLWVGRQVSPAEIARLSPAVEVAETAAAYEAGPEELVRQQWEWLLKPVEEPHVQGWDDLAFIVREASQVPQLRRLFPYTSHGALCLSRCTGYPYSRDCPAVTPRGGGRYRVADMAGRSLGEGNPQEAVALLLQHLPPHCGPAIHGTADDLPAGTGNSNSRREGLERA